MASESNLRQLKVLLRTGLGIVFFLEVLRWLEVVRLESALLHAVRPFFVFDLALVSAAWPAPLAPSRYEVESVD
jgi:hypothetical protein